MSGFGLTLLRHAQSEGNVRQAPQGHTDLPLTELGRQQAQALAARWQAEGRQFDYALCSTLSRAKQTSEILAASLNLEFSYEPLWIERNVGQMAELDAETREELYSNPLSRSPFQDAFDRGGEGQWELYLRAGQALADLMSRDEGEYLVISHGGLINALMYCILGIAPQTYGSGPRFYLDNTGFAELRYAIERHSWALLRFNDAGHLEGLDGG